MIPVVPSTEGSGFMRKFRLKSIPRRNESIRWREFGADGILLNPASGDYFEISETAMIIWSQMDGRKTIEEIIRELAARFDADAEDLTRETTEFIEDLTGKGLISIELKQEESRNKSLS